MPHEATETHRLSKRRQTTSHNNRAKSVAPTGSLPPAIHPNLQEIITITPPPLWYALNPVHQPALLSYNAAVRCDEKPPPSPTGTVISYHKDDGNGNNDIPRSTHINTPTIEFTIGGYGSAADDRSTSTIEQN
eukprot:CAMPEP_0201153072 /NCGR_PEP_ID=MMETSP0851-20130426/13606_1 /ASSEMBLY_ACC=CAM_ASM_000631 /TAXON_ID=183588 /ORGANISM="Pseudo-nitzschia fraudulenta, Strain WWA7" /LENGTH=132 /DNA_ID=CAMNT_0047430221 /DNA_START=408 /DNA_END=807 /DNA_ORIENTATION=+